MADILQRASDWLEDQRTKYATRVVVYQRGDSSVSLPATVGRTTFEVQGELGVVERTESRDFLVRAGDLVLDGAATLPQRGDRVREAAGDKVQVYEVMAPGQEPCWRYSDPYRKTLRIHTKQTDTEDA
ncbi:MAG: hypothetical protein NUV77_23015 [Thermoguttaceae bacterium]|jgi:hypothetical protein|nr:hypothetical protein [Thermoguttaceae bacterium]